MKLKNGEPFWKLPKRPPTPIEQFEPENMLHAIFVTSLAILMAKMYKLDYPKDFRSDERRKEIAKFAFKYKIEDFIPSKEKAQKINAEVEKDETEKEEE